MGVIFCTKPALLYQVIVIYSDNTEDQRNIISRIYSNQLVAPTVNSSTAVSETTSWLS